jgi:hypothetical protein
VIELDRPVGNSQAEFIDVKQVIQHQSSGRTSVRGFGYARTRKLGGQLIRKKNEVCRILEVDENYPRSVATQAFEVDAKAVCAVRQLITTTRPYPQLRPAYDGSVPDHLAPLMCRWKYTVIYRDARRRDQRRPVEYVLEHLLENESQSRYVVCEQWKKDTLRNVPIDIDEDHLPAARFATPQAREPAR